MKKLRIIGGLLAIVILIIAVCVPNRAPEAVIYNGKSLKNWALQMNSGGGASRDEAAAQFRVLGSNAVPGLIALLRTKDSFLRKEVWALAPKMPAPIKNVITRQVRPLEAAIIHGAAARSLAAIGSDAQAAVPLLAHMLQKDGAHGRAEAALALGSIGGRGTTELVAASESKDSNIRYASVYGLANVHSCDNAIVLALLKASGDPAAGIAVTAGGGLSKLGTNALPVVVRALDSPQKETRRQAARALGGLGASRDEIVPLLLKMLKDPDAACRMQAAQVLGTSALPNPTMAAGLIGALNDSDRDVRVAAIRGLMQGHRMAVRAVPDLARCLDDSSPLVREAAAQALGAMGRPAKVALPDLIRAADDKEETVRAAATGAIARIEEREGQN